MLRKPALILILLITTACSCKKNIEYLVQVFVSSTGGERLTQKSDLKFSKATINISPDITVNEEIKFQKIDGFGASFNEAGMICLNSLQPSSADSVMKNLFDPDCGAGFSLMKAPLAACDFSSAGPWYSFNDVPDDTLMQNFSINRDLQPDGIIPYIKMAIKYGNFKIHSTMDFPPDWMLFSLKNGEKHVKPEYYRALARYFVKYIKAYESQGISIDFLSPFNEPDNSWYTNVSYEEISKMIKYHIAPLFKESEIKTKIQFGETCNRTDGLKKLIPFLEDKDLIKIISTINVHGYDWNNFMAINSLHCKFPEVPVWMTEVCYAIESNIPPGGPQSVPVYDFNDIFFWADMIMNDLKSGVSAWIYWNMILDEKGGPWLIAPEHGNPDNNNQHPVVVINRKSSEITYTGLFYGLAHFSRFVRPGSFRIESSGEQENLNFCAFQNTNGKIVLNVLNRGSERKVRIKWKNLMIENNLPAFSLTTFIWKNR